MAKRQRTIRQAGAIVFRGGADELRVLVISARRNRKRWVLPKGTVKRSEAPADAALRELWEEAGIRGRVVGRVGTAAYQTADGRVECDYFLIRYTRQYEGEGEGREQRWCAVEDAISLLTYATARRAVLEAYPKALADAKRRRKAGTVGLRH